MVGYNLVMPIEPLKLIIGLILYVVIGCAVSVPLLLKFPQDTEEEDTHVAALIIVGWPLVALTAAGWVTWKLLHTAYLAARVAGALSAICVQQLRLARLRSTRKSK